MKHLTSTIVIVLLFVMHSNSIGQNWIEDNFPTKDGRIFYQEVVHVDSTFSTSDLYINAKTWMVDAFKSSKAVIETDLKEDGVIILKSYLTKYYKLGMINPNIWFVIKLELKPGRYRYSLYDVRYEYTRTAGGYSKHTEMDFEDWVKIPPGTKLSESKMKKVEDNASQYCQELSVEFKSTIESLKAAMSTIEKEEW
ncbi:MAG: DUF4468 domain-containing protein [Bacteroidales bacterium]|nr:DUF4468 domain-containing protein [Bacteroidales bacterium]